ncbi:MAG: heat-shock protein [Bacteroidetes bacterium HGW-Bacteroidetes-2]|jgi:uncharacterized membrane protein/heat shock protein HslJ|nr:MAG: heat-shock protein [Bacteroidetes bacterium HGW-Bacteroidetes-2]
MKIGVLYVFLFIVLSSCMNVNTKTEAETERYRQTSSGEKKQIDTDLSEESISKNDIVSSNKESIEQVTTSRVYFTAAGNEPFWGLEIAESGILFTTLDTLTTQFSAPFMYPTRAEDANVKIYEIETDEGEMQIIISEKECEDTMSGAISAYEVQVKLKRNTEDDFLTFLGCGSYAMDIRLQAYWALEKIGENQLEDSIFEIDFPHLEIQTVGNTFSGFAGCNKIAGVLFSELEVLRFIKVKSAKKICNQANIEDQFLEALQLVTTYSVTETTLKLKNPSRVVMQFKKAGK